MPSKNAYRDSSFELLRIFSIVLILLHHFAVRSNFDWSTVSATPAHLWYTLILMGGKVGSNVFVLISGYFLACRRGSFFQATKLVKLWGQLLFYSLSVFLIAGAVGIWEWNLHNLLYSCLPVSYNVWWFASTYFILFLLHPFLNLLLNALNRKAYQLLLTISLVCWCIIPTMTGLTLNGNDLVWFITLYSLAGYYRLHGSKRSLHAGHLLAAAAVTAALTLLVSFLFSLLGRSHSFFASHTDFFFDQNKLPVVIISCCLFLGFRELKLGNRKLINAVASCCFGIYLIHDHPVLSVPLWTTLFSGASYQDSAILIPYSLAAAAVVFLVCGAIDLFRQRFIEKPYLKLVAPAAERLEVLLSGESEKTGT